MTAPANAAIRLLVRRAPEKFGVVHYAVEIPAHLAIRIWGCAVRVVVELKPTGIVAAPVSGSDPWTAASSARNERAALSRLRAVLASADPYSLTQNNCEHFARYVVMGKRESTQISGALAVVCLVAGFAALIGASKRAA